MTRRARPPGPFLSVPHGFLGRPYDFSDAGWEESAAALAVSLGPAAPTGPSLFDAPLYVPRQVHGAGVTIIGPDEPVGHAVPSSRPEADAVVAAPGRRAPLVLGVRTADCLPVLLEAETGAGPVVGAVHAGWRGLAAGVVNAAVAAARSLGGGRVTLVAGPAAGPASYRVGREVIAAFGGRAVVTRPGEDGSGYLDLAATLRETVRDLPGVTVTSSGVCTMKDPAWHSFRRDGAARGANLGYVIAGV